MSANAADREKLHHICNLSYKAQAVWFLNSFWNTHQGEAEKFWAYVEKANAIDIEKHADGNALDELNAHRLLEIFDETLTVREMRTQLRSVGAIDEKEQPKLVPLAHLLLARYKAGIFFYLFFFNFFLILILILILIFFKKRLASFCECSSRF